MNSRPLESAASPLDLTGIKRIVFLDIDKTLFLSHIRSSVIYTGLSVDRWRAFVEILKADGSLIGIITKKDRCVQPYSGIRNTQGNIFNGLPELSSKEIGRRYDDVDWCLFNYDKKDKGLRELLTPELIYYLNCGLEGTKGSAMEHAYKNHLREKIPKEAIWLIDDNQFRVKASVEGCGFQFYLVPEAVHRASEFCGKLLNRAQLEEACIEFMLNALAKLGVKLGEVAADLLERIHRRYFIDGLAEEKTEARLPDTPVQVALPQSASAPAVSPFSLFQLKRSPRSDALLLADKENDEALANSAFGQGSHTAKRIGAGRR